MKKYLLLLPVLMSMICVLPAMAETECDIITVQGTTLPEMTETMESNTEYDREPGDIVKESLEREAKKTVEMLPSETVTSETEAEKNDEDLEQIPIFTNRWNLELNEEEMELLARITMLEAGGESDLGQQAVIEVILNRVYSSAYPNTVYEVLSQVDGRYRQFSTWKSRNSGSANPSARVRANVNAVANGETDVLPFETVYFSRKGENKKVQVKIGRHVFCNR